MKFDKEVQFLSLNETYNTETSTTEVVAKVEDTMQANVYRKSKVVKDEDFGEIVEEEIVCTIEGTYIRPFTYLRFEGDVYKKQMETEFRGGIRLLTTYTLTKMIEPFEVV